MVCCCQQSWFKRFQHQHLPASPSAQGLQHSQLYGFSCLRGHTLNRSSETLYCKCKNTLCWGFFKQRGRKRERDWRKGWKGRRVGAWLFPPVYSTKLFVQPYSKTDEGIKKSLRAGGMQRWNGDRREEWCKQLGVGTSTGSTSVGFVAWSYTWSPHFPQNL